MKEGRGMQNLTQEMINNAYLRELEEGKSIDDQQEHRVLSDALTEYTASLQAKYFERYYRMGFEDCLKLNK